MAAVLIAVALILVVAILTVVWLRSLKTGVDPNLQIMSASSNRMNANTVRIGAGLGIVAMGFMTVGAALGQHWWLLFVTIPVLVGEVWMFARAGRAANKPSSR